MSYSLSLKPKRTEHAVEKWENEMIAEMEQLLARNSGIDDELPEVRHYTEEDLAAMDAADEVPDARLITDDEVDARQVLRAAGFDDVPQSVTDRLADYIRRFKMANPELGPTLPDEYVDAIASQLQSDEPGERRGFTAEEEAKLERWVLDSALYTVEDWMQELAALDWPDETKRTFADTVMSYRREHRQREPVTLDPTTRRPLTTIGNFIDRSRKVIAAQLDNQRVVSTAAADVIATAEEWNRELTGKRRPNRKEVTVVTRLLDDARRLESSSRAVEGLARGYRDAVSALGNELLKFLEDAIPGTVERYKRSQEQPGSDGEADES